MLTSAPDGFGGLTSSYSMRGDVWCKITDKSGGESSVAGRVKEQKTIELITHYRDDIIATDKVELDGVTYDISEIENIDRRGIYLRITADSNNE